MTTAFEHVPPPDSITLPGWAGDLGPVLSTLPGVGVRAVPETPRLVVFGADHSVADLAVSVYPAEMTASRLKAAAERLGPLGSMAAAQEIPVDVVDLTAAGDLIAARAGRIDVEDGLSDADLHIALQAGRDAADAAVDSGADLLIAAVCSVAVTTPVAVLAAEITGLEPVDTTGRGSGISDAAWIRKAAAVRDALFRARQQDGSPAGLLRSVGGADLAAMTGFLAQAATRRTPILIDDETGTVCAILANRMALGTERWVTVATLHRGTTHGRLLTTMGNAALLGWGLPVSGCGSLSVLPAIRAAAAALLPGGEPTAEDAVARWDPDLL
jgi:nicotinate-nucleotide--dimethylbenzimidazole phosphoribosyltransferase